MVAQAHADPNGDEAIRLIQHAQELLRTAADFYDKAETQGYAALTRDTAEKLTQCITGPRSREKLSRTLHTDGPRTVKSADLTGRSLSFCLWCGKPA